jgi:hypothetical protein
LHVAGLGRYPAQPTAGDWPPNWSSSCRIDLQRREQLGVALGADLLA